MKNLIVKEDVIKTIKNADVFTTYHEKDPIEEAVDRAIRATKRSIIYDIEILPSAQIQKKGEWIPAFNGVFKDGTYWFTCSECERMVPEVRNGGWNFCPSCGSYNGK